MLCVSLYQPEATLVVIGEKTNETRSWSTKYRGRLLIHATKRFTRGDLSKCYAYNFIPALRRFIPSGDISPALPHGAILGSVEVVECLEIIGDPINFCACGHADHMHKARPRDIGYGHCQALGCASTCRVFRRATMSKPPEPELSFGDYTPGRYAWVLRHPIRFPLPIPFRGHQKLFDVPERLVPAWG